MRKRCRTHRCAKNGTHFWSLLLPPPLLLLAAAGFARGFCFEIVGASVGVSSLSHKVAPDTIAPDTIVSVRWVWGCDSAFRKTIDSSGSVPK